MAKKRPAAVKKRAPKKRPRKPSSKPVVEVTRPTRLLAGKRVAMAGKFESPAAVKLLNGFLRHLGANNVKTVDDKTDILIYGDGAKSALQKKAEKLNAAGAEIVIVHVDDLRELLPTVPNEFAAYFRDPKLLKEFRKIIDFRLFHWQDLILDGEDFSKTYFGFPTKDALWLELISIRRCDFAKATLTDFSAGDYDDEVADCCFDGAVFNNAFLTSALRCSFKNVTGKRMGVGRLNKSPIRNAKLDRLVIYKANNSEIVGCTARQFGEGHHGEFTKSKIQKCRFGDVNLDDATSNGATFDDVQFGKGTIQNGLFTKTKFKQVRFENLKNSNLVFDRCELVDCVFHKCSGSVFDLRNSKIRNCEFTSNSYPQIFANQAQADKMTGLKNYIDRSKLGSMRKLSKAILDSDEVSIDLRGQHPRKKTVALKLQSRYHLEMQFRSTKDKKHRKQFESIYMRNCTVDELTVALIGLLAEAQIESIDAGSLKTKTTRCPLSTKQFQEQVVKAFDDVLGVLHAE